MNAKRLDRQWNGAAIMSVHLVIKGDFSGLRDLLFGIVEHRASQRAIAQLTIALIGPVSKSFSDERDVVGACARLKLRGGRTDQTRAGKRCLQNRANTVCQI